ncbi:SNF2 family N-terminal domain-containing protein [Radiomyces spectabilis]|uniref:SNF2 family N-terminal domain-containing protein n=1 Tax=Radiomyces spectabilis TaxID=64574 RepID=UPI002220CE2B|nr:SNF2 family N-terminal domain-containing protein [Radiomyces spectabilis]KAI8368263.1 SNF2 family N-terminal domain-containing protein [Radiomyces spectabilis]
MSFDSTNPSVSQQQGQRHPGQEPSPPGFRPLAYQADQQHNSPSSDHWNELTRRPSDSNSSYGTNEHPPAPPLQHTSPYRPSPSSASPYPYHSMPNNSYPSASSAWDYTDPTFNERPSATAQTYATARDYPKTSYDQPDRYSQHTTAYDPVHENAMNVDPIVPLHRTSHDAVQNAPSAPAYLKERKTHSPVMSISHMLSSDTSDKPASSAHPISPVLQPASSNPPANQPSRNGIHSLLNSTEDTFEMADSDTDTEDIPLYSTAQPIVTEVDDTPVTEPALHAIPSAEPSTFSANVSVSSDQRPMEPAHADHEVDDHLSDDSSVDDFARHSSRSRQTSKSLAERTLEELQLSDDDDDEDILYTQRDAMIQYMIDVHNRRKRVIEAYEKRSSSKHSKVHERLQQTFMKRYGVPMPKVISEPLGHKDRLRHKKKRFRRRFSEDLSQTEEDITVVKSPTLTSQERMEEERRKIWLAIARKDIPRMAKILTRVQATRAGNCKKVAQYCQKEAKRAATKGGRLNRDVQLKAKRAMKEMLIFWKKNEKEERELRKKAEKEALDRLKQEEERREAQRQARKLNFLITQTELYSHFIGRKIKQDVGEDDETAVPVSEGATPAAQSESVDLDVTEGEQPLGEIDFDEDDEEKLKEHARISAQNALAKQREATRQFDEKARERRIAAGDSAMNVNQAQLDEMNFQDPTSMGTGPEIKQPSILMCQLKSYQLKGLNWLGNLYEQGINGILADEMGLGKTVQSISLMAYLAEVHNIWGPFLVIAPASTLHNWQQEITKFVPSFRALPYWGNPKDRKVLRQFWNRKQLYGRDAPFHIVITSYQLVLTDVKNFQRVKWQYMVLDEAQAIKSSSSARWKQLLGFHCRNRLLLTGTPIQNSMQELWALLHFIMPTLFDSHEEFSEWFSKDIESHAENKGSLNEHQLRRLHMILKPFMLRRIKRNVQHELGEKIEVEVYCDLTARQKALYRGLKEKISISELLEKAKSLTDVESMDSLMNLVMQFRKVCNHPELFERADVQAPLSFCQFGMTGSLVKEAHLYLPYATRSPITYHIPRKLYRNGGILRVPGPQSNAGFTTRYLDNLMNIWSCDYIHESMFSSESDAAFSFLRFTDMSAHDASFLFKQSIIVRWVAHLSRLAQRAQRKFYIDGDESYPTAAANTYASFLIAENESILSPVTMVPNSPLDQLTHISDNVIYLVRKFNQCYSPKAQAVPIDMVCSDRSFEVEQKELLFDSTIRATLFGQAQYINWSQREHAAQLADVMSATDNQGIMTVPASGHGYSHMRIPAMSDLILDSGKLAKLDGLLEKLKAEGHRCLVYFQMTRMIDLFEEYIAYKQYKYLRLDGSSKISERRDMVTDWQTRPEIFIFLLSTRAGGLGINLTAADTVIFYDSDWNPTVDQQAMDRAHRLGQTKQVTVYRLITKGTIEERILQRAKQKDEIQKVVISGGEFKQVDFKPREIVSLLLDDEELDNKLQQQLKRKAEDEESSNPATPTGKRAKKGSGSSTQNPGTIDQLFSAGGDTLPEDNLGESSKGKRAPERRKSRIGRPRTNISFTG